MTMAYLCQEVSRLVITMRIAKTSTQLEMTFRVVLKLNKMFHRAQKTTKLHMIVARVDQPQQRVEVVNVSNFLKFPSLRHEV